MAWASICLSVCLSVTLLYCVKTVQVTITKSLPKVSSFLLTKFCAFGCGNFFRTRTSKGGTSLKRRYFAVIGSFSVKTVADRYIHADCHNKHWLQDFKIYQHRWPWTTLTSKRVLVNFSQFWMQRTFQHWIATKWLEIDQDNLRMKFLALNVDFSSLSPDFLNSMAWQGGRRWRASKTATSPKKWLLCRYWLV